ncbi:hypothetical protein QQF64_002117 [Cirrhinus molitorella]|uniref:Uncharacterized protein n=1 Tax=Cirrhinus molitorella TaxID=172907 RepID=A0ABR3MP86_9TELE
MCNQFVFLCCQEIDDTVDLCEEMLQISMLVKELPASLPHSGYEVLEDMMFFSLWRAMISRATCISVGS